MLSEAGAWAGQALPTCPSLVVLLPDTNAPERHCPEAFLNRFIQVGR